jgi:hypothetical protein
MRKVRPIRCLLVSTGEDFPMHNASGLARTVVVQVPNRTKDFDLAARCRQMSPNYRGLMADFIAYLIRDERKSVFVSRVEHWWHFYYTAIAGRQNDGRIAGNHALLAAAFEQLAAYLSDVWPEWETDAREYAEKDLLKMVHETVGEAEQEQASTIFLDTVRSLVECNQVWINGLNDLGSEKRRHDPMIGRVVNPGLDIKAMNDTVLELRIRMALEAVQKSLKNQGKPKLALGDQALIQQLAASGLLLVRFNAPKARERSTRSRPKS